MDFLRLLSIRQNKLINKFGGRYLKHLDTINHQESPQSHIALRAKKRKTDTTLRSLKLHNK